MGRAQAQARYLFGRHARLLWMFALFFGLLAFGGKPDSVGFDPYNKLIDKVSGDNRKSVAIR